MSADVVTVIVVDDHALHRDGTSRILAQYDDLQVIGEADSAELGLALINKLAPAGSPTAACFRAAKP